MAEFVEFDPEKQPRYKVELHAHLDGSMRLSTIWELAQKKGIDLKVKTLEDLSDFCLVKHPSTLLAYLKPLYFYTRVVWNDEKAIERIAYEFCEDAERQGVVYSEVRFTPHLLTSPDDSSITPREAVKCVLKGLNRGAKDFNLTVRCILSCLRSRPEWSKDIFEMCVEFKEQGVVGIDIAGDDSLFVAEPETIQVFKMAAKEGIHRTCHACEVGPAENIRVATTELQVERIGHGYHVVDDKEIYSECIKNNIHFEVCPYSSILTGAVNYIKYPKHPIVQFVEDGVDFSINRDDTALIQKTFDEEYQFLRSLGLKDVHFARANFNAVRNCFLPEDQKQELMEQLICIYGVTRHGKQPKIRNIPVKTENDI